MKSIANQYRDLKEGKISQANFMRNIRMTFPQYVTNVTSFDDSIKILKNKGILVESMGPEEAMRATAEELAKQMGDYISAVAALEDEMGLSQAEAIAIASEIFPENDDEFNNMIKKGEEEESGKYTKFDDFEGGISESINKSVNINGKTEYGQFDEKANVNFNELVDGITIEHECHPEKSYDEIVKIVMKNLKKDSFYYTIYKLTGTPGNEMQTMDSSKPEDHQMKFYTEKNAVDKARGMKKVKVEKKKIKENKEETNPQPSSDKKDDKKVEKPKEFRPGVNLGASFEKFKKQLEEMVHEAINEYYDGRDNIDAENK
jgi:hypothetical protein